MGYVENAVVVVTLVRTDKISNEISGTVVFMSSEKCDRYMELVNTIDKYGIYTKIDMYLPHQMLSEAYDNSKEDDITEVNENFIDVFIDSLLYGIDDMCKTLIAEFKDGDKDSDELILSIEKNLEQVDDLISGNKANASYLSWVTVFYDVYHDFSLIKKNFGK